MRDKLLTAILVASLGVVPASRASADARDVAAGVALLFGIGVAIDQHRRNNRPPVEAAPVQPAPAAARTPPAPAPWSEQRRQDSQMQEALNDFGFDVGPADGLVGPRTGNGIERYQAEMGFPVTGRMTQQERDFLFSSQARLRNGAGSMPAYAQAMTQGPRGLMRAFRNEQLGQPAQSPASGLNQASAQPAQQPVQQPVSPTLPVAAAPSDIPIFDLGEATRSSNQHCNEINILTTTNGGYMDAATVTDGRFALNEQFCLARAFAVQDSTRMTQGLANFSQEQIEDSCAVLPAFVAAPMAMLGSATPSEVVRSAGASLQGSGRSSAQLASTGKVCLGVGYKTDDADVALASALLLTGAGQTAYGELVGHHLREGLGVAVSETQGAAWVSTAVGDLENGAEPAFLPGQSAGRVAVLKAALVAHAQAGAQTGAVKAADLPTFFVPAAD